MSGQNLIFKLTIGNHTSYFRTQILRNTFLMIMIFTAFHLVFTILLEDEWILRFNEKHPFDSGQIKAMIWYWKHNVAKESFYKLIDSGNIVNEINKVVSCTKMLGTCGLYRNNCFVYHIWVILICKCIWWLDFINHKKLEIESYLSE